MINIDVSGLPEVQRALRTAADQVPFALSKAINATAFKVRTAEQGEMRSVFDRPTPWVIRQPRVQKATKQTLTATIGSQTAISGRPGVFDKVMAPHVQGGVRLRKPMEHELVKAGIMPAGWVAVAGPSAKLNQYGNISRALWLKLLEEAQLNTGSARYFAARQGDPRTRHLRPGIYERYGRKRKLMHCIVLFKSQASYRRSVDWELRARAVVNREFPAEFNQAFQDALRTRR